MAAAAAGAAAPVPPHIVARLENPLTADPRVLFEADAAVVTATPCLSWDVRPAAGAAPATASLPTTLMMKYFLSRARISSARPQDVAAFDESVLVVVVNGNGWAQLINEYAASGLFDSNWDSVVRLEAAMSNLVVQTPANLLLDANHVVSAEGFDTPAAAGRGRGRGQGGRGGGAGPTPGPVSLRFLALTSVNSLVQPGSPLPCQVWGDLMGMLGPFATRAVREADTSMIQVMADVMVPNINKFAGTSNAGAATVAAELAPFLQTARLPALLRSEVGTSAVVRGEATDAFRYVWGGPLAREVVVTRRLHHARVRVPCLASNFLDQCHDGGRAYQLLTRLKNILPRDRRDAPMVELIELIESKLSEHRCFLAEFINRNNVSLEEVADAVLREVATVSAGSAAGPSAGGAGTSGVAPAEPLQGALRDDAIQAALTAPQFRRCALAMISIDLDTEEGRREAFDAAFSSGSALIVRLLSHGSAVLARRHPLLASLHEVRGELYSYFNYCQVVDKTTGTVSSRARRWSWTEEDNSDDTQLSLFLRQKYASMDWVNAPLGALGWKAVFTGQTYKPVDSRDHYVILSVIKEVQKFGDRTFTAFGFPSDVPAAQGYSWKTFFDFYLEHLELATNLNSRAEQYSWLEKADKQCRAALRCMGNEVRRRLESASPVSVVFGALLPHDAAPVQALREQQQSLGKLADFREQFDWLRGESSAPMQVDELPLLSERRPSLAGARSSRGMLSPPRSRSRSPSPLPASSRKKATVTFASSGESEDDTYAKKPRRELGGKGKAKADEGAKRGEGGELQPSHRWLTPKKLLFVSGKVWDIPATARSLKVAVGAKCWPVVLSRRSVRNKMIECDQRGQAGHRKVSDAAHVLDVELRELEERSGLCRVPTAAEGKRLAAAGLHRGRQGGGQPSRK